MQRARLGQNQKSKRFLLRGRRKLFISVKRHQVTMCGNVGCKRCFPHLNENFPPNARFTRNTATAS